MTQKICLAAIEYILLDLGGVLYRLGIIPVTRRLLPHLTDDEIMARWQELDSRIPFERGLITEAEFLDSAPKEFGVDMGPGSFLDFFNDWLGFPFDDATEVLVQIKKRWRVGCLSNTNAIHIRHAMTQGPLLDLFDERYYSHEIGFHKPDIRIYQSAIKKIGLDPKRIWFFDDLQQNVNAARGAGLNASLCNGTDALKKLLGLGG
ncbi:MAG: HAD family phosphatase [Deltaproteobacteria bacterium]|nr:HAD family phosphatase [Deltaproteobacteria bacterium]